MYLIADDFGTRRRVWSRTEALSWLCATSANATVTNLWGRVVATRKQARAY